MQSLMINEEVVYTQVEDEIVMMSPNDGTYHGLNLVGAELWMLLEENPMTLKDMAAYLQATYVLDETIALNDASVFVEAMLAEDFLMHIAV